MQKYDIVLVDSFGGHLEITVVDEEPEEILNDDVLTNVTIEEYSEGYIRLEGSCVFEDDTVGTVKMGSGSWEIWDERRKEYT